MSIVSVRGVASTRIQALTRWIPTRSLWIRIRSCPVIPAGCIPQEICSGARLDSLFGSSCATCVTLTYIPLWVSRAAVNFGWIPTPFSTDFWGPNWSVIDAPRHGGAFGPLRSTCQGSGRPWGTLHLSDDLDILFLQVPTNRSLAAPIGRRGRRAIHSPEEDLWVSESFRSPENCPSCDPRGASCKSSRCCEAPRGKQVPSPSFCVSIREYPAVVFSFFRGDRL